MIIISIYKNDGNLIYFKCSHKLTNIGIANTATNMDENHSKIGTNKYSMHPCTIINTLIFFK